MRVLLTGATGFVGSHVAEALLAAGNEVRCLVRNPDKLARLLGAAVNRMEVVSGDLQAEDALRAASDGVAAVVHVAGLVAAVDRAEFLRVNEQGTANLVAAARDAALSLERFVYVGSLSAAGPTRRGQRWFGDEAPAPVSHYGESKAAGERVVQASGLPWIVVRPPAVYGPRDTEFLRLFRAARKGVAPVFGDGSQELSLVQVEDLAQAIVAALTSGKDGAVYYACHDEVVSARELAHAVGRAVGRANGPRVIGIPRWIVPPMLGVTGAFARLAGKATLLSADKAAEFLAEGWACSPERLRSDTGWEAVWGLEEGMSRTGAWYRAQGWL